MIDEALICLKSRLNTFLNAGIMPDEAREEQVVFLEGEHMDPLSFKLGAVSILLINVEEENTLRAPDPYLKPSSNGTNQKVHPEIRLNLYVLFVARFKQYSQSLNHLSQIIRYFQNHRLLDHHTAPELSENIDKLVIELVTLPFSEQNEVWNALRVTYHPSVLYKVKMVVFRDDEAVRMPELKEKEFKALP
jgi:hypothetical protein